VDEEVRHKIVNPSDIDRSKGKVVLCQGCFDLVHIGHIKHLEAAKKFGDVLVVAVTADRFVNKGPGRPYFKQDLRMEYLSSLALVDYVVLSDDESAVPIIEAVKPDVYVKGQDYRNLEEDITGKILLEKEAVEKLGGRLEFTEEITFSSTRLLNKFFDPLDEKVQVFLNSLTFGIEDVQKLLDSFSDLKILVVGESIFDKYTFVDVMNAAAKHSVLSSKFLNEEIHCGGVLATARHIAQFCKNVSVLTLLSPSKQYEVSTMIPNVNIIGIEVPEYRTIIKQRFLDEKGKQLFRMDFLEDFFEEGCKEVYEEIERIKDYYDVVLINDFGHGMLNKWTASKINLLDFNYLALNVQTNSANKGYNPVTKYTKAHYISIDLPEGRLAIHDKYAAVTEVAKKLRWDIKYQNLSITHGKYGTHVFDQAGAHVAIPVFSTDTVDSTGAGDAYFSITSLLAYKGAPLEMIGLIGNAVGALAIRIMGNREPINGVLLRKYLTTLMK
jgi:rfaE bifunctional protein nucleotidyltransferase chain/domain